MVRLSAWTVYLFGAAHLVVARQVREVVVAQAPASGSDGAGSGS